MLLGKFFKSCFVVVSRRGLLFALVNLFYFGSVFVGAFLAHPRTPALHEEVLEVPQIFPLEAGLFVMVLNIFLFNFFVSGFSMVTLSGLVFFPLSLVVLVLRAGFWGWLLGQLSTPQFLLAFPTLVLEGEGYVFASVAGVVLGLSWLKTDWLYGNEDLSRWEAFKMACRECIRLYVFVALFLFMAAIVEAVTITWLT